ncbi:hypothetical protein [Rhizobium oryzicola]|uniref:Uncharacterized protein n=1 Tax=Rhizobium oryzicola TaxID=1232668 RepID=A0ABT8SY11_9HYPH|nr:hypothetical protein [Rhizobium oryzicola]MDO1583175.1 hypothetical protein [Rhizobium oryzicola]
MRIRSLDVGLESVSRWQLEDEVHLPDDCRVSPNYLPSYRALDSILYPPSLDDRLPDLLQPRNVDPQLMEPSILQETRAGLAAIFHRLAIGTRDPADRLVFRSAGAFLDDEVNRDAEVRAALALLLRA